MNNLGFGLGLRKEHYSHVFTPSSRVDWFEVITENFLPIQGAKFVPHLDFLLKVREQFPVVLHGVSLSIGSPDELDKPYLKSVLELAKIIQPPWISDHLCFTGVGGKNSHDLLPLAYTGKNVDLVVRRVQQAQEFLQRVLVLENVSSYVEFSESEMSEQEFIAQVVKRSGCNLLLDLNNIFVSCHNHGSSAMEFLTGIPSDSIAQIHLAGPTQQARCLIDTHSSPVRAEVWALFEKSLDLYGPKSTMVEWDEKIPDYLVLRNEILKAKKITEAWKLKNEISARTLL